ncbi:uncharacterized protein METZ01_LOCUS452854 [marine metagenome]|uniref:Uncharacterized protein n=1 Tax=marine metagenome TaxID=408172 RepID=A0A382ZXH5_9ZZZZ|tara:strand:+ start:186 stop:452 length:267 start_codon:yes stop_codon:yes gene_type:complete
MINIPIMVKTVERVVRIVPFVRELLPSNKDGLNSLIQEDPLQSDSDEILKLNKKIKEQDKALYAKKQEIVVLKKKIELLQETIGGYQS